MKILRYFIVICLIATSCNQKNDNKSEEEEARSTASKTPILIEEKRRKKIEENQKIYGNHKEHSFKIALDTAKKYLSLEKFKKEFYHEIPESDYGIFISINIDRPFNRSQKHLTIKRGFDDWTHVYIFKIEKHNLIPVLKHGQEGHSFIEDTIFDVNGDKLKDFLIHSFSSAGCCPRNLYTVYLNKGTNGEFISEKEFMNPTFYPKEKKILGMTYGHIGAVSLYKFKWKGTEIDTIEYIYKDTNSNNKYPYFKTKKEVWLEDTGTIVPLEKIPKEYIGIGNDWFDIN